MFKPYIGVTANKLTQVNHLRRTVVNESYLQAILMSGGIPVVIPSGISFKQVEGLLASLNGILFTGGVEDIDPACYDTPMHPKISDIDPERDDMEISLVKLLVQKQKPFMGICRGIEIINVALGGTLYTYLDDELPNALPHAQPYDPPLNKLIHTVQIETPSILRQLLGENEVWVNSFHHQGIRNIAPGLKASAFSKDGLVEGLEIPGHPFAVGVQWHPEELTDDERMLNLFRGLVNASVK